MPNWFVYYKEFEYVWITLNDWIFWNFGIVSIPHFGQDLPHMFGSARGWDFWAVKWLNSLKRICSHHLTVFVWTNVLLRYTHANHLSDSGKVPCGDHVAYHSRGPEGKGLCKDREWFTNQVDWRSEVEISTLEDQRWRGVNYFQGQIWR